MNAFFKALLRKELLKTNDFEAWLNGQKEVVVKHGDLHEFEPLKANLPADEKKYESVPATGWKAGYKYPNEQFVAVHSTDNELQGYTGGKNVEKVNGGLRIMTRKEHVQAMTWSEKSGMVKREFEWSSDLMNNGIDMDRNGGVVMIKMSCKGRPSFGACLMSADKTTMMNVMEVKGKKVYAGVRPKPGMDAASKELKGLKAKREYIYTVKWTSTEIVWFVNNMEVFRTDNFIPSGKKMCLHLYGRIDKDVRRRGEGVMEVAWVKEYAAL